MKFRSKCSVLATLMLAQGALSQVVIPPGLEPGQIQQQLRQLRLPPPTSEIIAPRAPEQVAPAQTEGVRFVLREVQIENLKTYSTDELAPLFAPSIGKEISVADVFAIANRMTARFRGDGYILSQVLVPAQSIVDGRVRMTAVEGFIDSVEYRGRVGQSALLNRYSAKLRASRPLKAKVLERYLLLLNDLPQTTARGTLTPSNQTAGAAHLIIDIARGDEHAGLEVDNRNSRSLGPWRASVDLELDHLLFDWDAVTVRGGWSPHSELSFASAGFGMPLGTQGAQWNLNVTGVRARPGLAANLAISGLKTESISGQLQVTYPLVRSRSLNIQLRGALTSFDGQSAFDFGTVSNDRLRAMRLGLAWDATDRWRGINSIDTEYSQGFNAFGAREHGAPDSPLSRVNGSANFSKLTLYAARLQSLGGPWSALLAVSAQQSFNTLLAPELFAFGGELFGRGYDSAELVGDSGESAKVELRHLTTHSYVGALVTYAFYDVGRVRRRDPINESPTEHASAVGAGVRWTSTNGRWYGFLEAANPLDHIVAADGDPGARVFVGLQVRY